MEDLNLETQKQSEIENDLPKNKSLFKRAVIFPLFAALLLGLGVILYQVNTFESTDDAYIDTTTVNVAPKISGQIIKVLVEDNQVVKEGDLVAVIEPDDYQIKVEQATAHYERALLNQQNAKANYDAVKSRIDLAQKDLDRYKALYADGAVSKQDLDRAQTKYDNAAAEMVNADQAVISAAQNKVADAEISGLKASMKQAKLYLSYTNIYAPIDGTVASKRVEKGMYVTPGSALFTVVPHKSWIQANFKENQLEHIKEGQSVDIKIDTYPHHIFKGKVDSIQMVSGAKSSMFPPENAVGSFVKIVQRVPVKIIFTDEEDIKNYKIIPGMSVVPKIRIRA